MKRILIIEDDKVIAGAYKQRFTEAGYAVDLAPNGLEGIKLVTAVKPDIVLLDLLMPRLDGIEVLKFIRGHPEIKHLAVVVFSNSFMTNLVEAAWRAGADQCLMKASTTPTQLFDAVNKAMSKGAARKASGTGVGSAGPLMAPSVNPLARPPTAAPMAPPAPLPPAASAYIAPPSMPPASAYAYIQPPPPPASPTPFAVPSAPAAPTSQAEPASHSAPERAAGSIQAEADPEFQAQIRQLFINSSASKLASIRNLATAFVQGDGSLQQSTLLTELFRKIHSMTGNAALAGCQAIAEFASTFEALLQELLQQPSFINASARRTVANAVDFVELQFKFANHPEAAAPMEDSVVLVLEADLASAQSLQQTLARADLKAEVSVDAVEALGLMASNPFTLVIVPADMPGISGFELFAQMQSLPGHRNTPALFVTAVENFAAHCQPEVLGDNDLLAKPYLSIELIIKAVIGVKRRRFA